MPFSCDILEMVMDVRKICVATSNQGKLREYRAMIEPLGITATHPAEMGIEMDVEETGATFFENALIKARAYAKKTSLPILADDSGLLVDVLDGAPGIKSKRLTPDGKDSENNRELLRRLNGETNRKAHFHCSLVYLDEKADVYHFVGRVDGIIARYPRGEHGFGYDPLFIVSGTDKTLAAMDTEEKNKHTHRFHALKQWQIFMGWEPCR